MITNITMDGDSSLYEVPEYIAEQKWEKVAHSTLLGILVVLLFLLSIDGMKVINLFFSTRNLLNHLR